MEQDRSSFLHLYQTLTDHFAPHRGRYFLDDQNRGDRRDTYLHNNQPLLAGRILDAGLMSGNSSPARPWFRLSSGDERLDKVYAVREWLHECSRVIYRVYSMSNLYNSLQTFYSELRTFGTAAIGVFEDDVEFLRFETLTAGQYAVGMSAHEKIDSKAIRRNYRVEALVKEYGLDACPAHVKNMWKNGQEHQTVEVIRLVEPNDDRDSQSPWAWDKPYRCVVWVAGARADEKPLLVSGYDEFPYMVARWDVAPGDMYATSCPGIVAIGDAKAVQAAERDIMVAQERIADPAMLADQRLRRVLGDYTPPPGKVVYSEDMNAGMRELISGYRPDLGAMISVATRYERRINDAFYVDLFMMLSETDRRQITAREVTEKHEEKLLQLGPVLERMHNELYDPMISRSFRILQKKGLFPDAPEELVGRELRVEYISVLAQAQRLASLASLERVTQFAMALGQVDPYAVRKINTGKALDECAEIVGVAPSVLRSEEEMDAMRQQDAQAQAQAQAMQAAGEAAAAAKDASQADLSGDNALSTVMRRAGLA